MMDEDKCFLTGMVFGLFLGVFLTCSFVRIEINHLRTIKNEAISSGVGQFTPKTGEFEWLK
jgi:hypothetical protein